MKERTSVISLLIIIALTASAQVPQKFNYQAVVRNAEHGLVTGQDVGFKLSILEGTAFGSPVYVETHNITANEYGIADLVIGDGSVVSGVFNDIPWGEASYFLKVEVDPSGGSAYEHLGTSQLISVPYSLYSGNLSSPTRKFTVQEEAGHPVDSALFEVRNAEGQTVFAVYPEGTRVYVVDEPSKGVKGGFAVGGLSRNGKGVTQEFMHISPDSIRMYVDEESTKGVKGGFAVGGFSRGKGPTDQYFALNPANASFTLVSDSPDQLSDNSLTITNRSRTGGAADQGSLFNLTRDNYFIGHRAGEAITTGSQNSFIGYESGANTTTGWNNVYLGFSAGRDNISGSFNVCIGTEAGLHALDGYNVFIGSQAGTNHVDGGTNVFVGRGAGENADTSVANIFIGNMSGYRNSGGWGNVFAGNHTGRENIKGTENTFIGCDAGGENINGDANTFIGAWSGLHNVNAIGNVFVGKCAGQYNVSGNTNVFVGQNAGLEHASGNNNIFIGDATGLKNTTGESNVFIGSLAGFHNNGSENIFIGFNAGTSETGDGKLYIDINNNDSHNALIYGEFYNNRVQINHRLGIGMAATDNALEVAGNASKTAPGEWLANSDARIKREVLDIENACELISRLRPVTFRFTEEWMLMNPSVKDEVYYNFIAQEYREVFPESVQRGGGFLEGDEDPLLQLDSHPANVVAIKAIQELTEQNREQQALIEELMQKVSVLENALNNDTY